MKIKMLFIVVLGTTVLSAQSNDRYYSFDINNFYGSILRHNPDISHLIKGHPTGVILAFNRKTTGAKRWERLHHYPDFGLSFIHQDMDNSVLGEHFGVFGHYNFYFFKRKVMFRIAQGISYNTNPFDAEKNFKNNAYGTHLLSSTYALLNYKKQNIIGGLGVQAGLGIIHYSNANFRAPNTSTNTFIFNVGIDYLIDQDIPDFVPREEGLLQYSEPMKLSIFLRSGVNESDVVGSGQFPFLVVGALLDKRLNKKSILQLGTEVFFSGALERFIDYRASGNFKDNVTGDEDAKRVGLFVGHELQLGKFSIPIQFGYYVHYPFDFEGTTYNRVALKYHLTKEIFLSSSVKSHSAKAETVEFTLGYRF